MTEQDDIPTLIIRPDPNQKGSPDGTKLTRDEIYKRAIDHGYSPAGAEGITRNFLRESGGDSKAIGDGGTSRGLGQWHKDRKTDLEAFAKANDSDPDDPDVQFKFLDKELKEKFPTLRAKLVNAEDPAEAEDAFKRIYERPASVMWANGPRTSSPNYQYSDYALGEHDGRKNTDLVMMPPQDYLDLSPGLSGNPFSSPSGRALLNSTQRGDKIESVPTLDVHHEDNTARVVDQDGRHRALLAQQEGVDAIPVAIRRTGQGQPTEIQGMSGNVLPHDFPKVADKSLFQRVAQAVIPSAEAAEPINPYAGLAELQKDETVSANPYAGLAEPADSPDGMVGSAIKGAAAGLGKTVLAGQELIGKGLETVADIAAPLTRAVGADPQQGIVQRAGEWLVNDARKGTQNLTQEMAPDQAAHPVASTIGDIGGSMMIPGGLAGKMGGNALRVAATGGGLSGLLQPGSEDGYWKDKALQAGVGATSGLAAGRAGDMLSKIVAPQLRVPVNLLVKEGVELTPGQVAGGQLRALEDKAMSLPIAGDAIAAARRRSFETFDRAAWNRVLQPLGKKMPDAAKMGREAMDYVDGRIKDAYQSILPNLSLNSIQSDPVWTADMMAAVRDARGSLPDADFRTFGNIVRAQLEEKLGPAGSSVDGNLINGIDSQLGSEVRGYKSSGEHDKRKIGDALGEVQDAFRDLLERQNPNQAEALRRVRESYANFVRVGKAASAQGTATTDGIFSPAQLNAAVRSENNTTRKMGYGKGKALLQDLSDAGQAVLPSKYPDSGTAGRNMIGYLLGGGALGGSWASGGMAPALGTLGLLGLGATPYTPPVSRAANAALSRLAQAPGPTRNALAEMLRNAGAVAAPAAGAVAAGLIPGAHP